MPCIEEADVVFAASGSEELLVHAADVSAMRPAGPSVGGMRRFFDISVPRNIDPKVDELESAGVWNVDDLQEVGDGSSFALLIYLGNVSEMLLLFVGSAACFPCVDVVQGHWLCVCCFRDTT